MNVTSPGILGGGSPCPQSRRRAIVLATRSCRLSARRQRDGRCAVQRWPHPLALRLPQRRGPLGVTGAQSATAFHGACQHAPDLVATERNKSMSSASKLVAIIPRTEASESMNREISPFAASLLSRWDARSADDHSAQLNSRVSSTLTARESDILAMIGQGLSNKQIARALEISPETVKSHVKRIFLKLAVKARSEAVFRAVSLGLL